MKLEEHYDNKTAAAFGRDLLERLAPYPFGGIPKRDLDCLLFFLLKKHGLIPGDMNRDKAYSLGISESKYKSLLVDSDAKFVGERTRETRDANVKKLFDRLISSDNEDPHVSLEGDTLVFVEEDSIIKDDFTQAMKENDFYTDTSFNSEIIKVKAAGFLAFAKESGYISEDKIYEFLRKDEIDEKSIETFKKSKMTAKEIMQGVLNILKKQDKFGIHTIIEMFVYAGDVASAKRHK